MNTGFVRLAVATVPTVYGIETVLLNTKDMDFCQVATVPTVYGIETYLQHFKLVFGWFNKLQQYLPFTVLKPLK